MLRVERIKVSYDEVPALHEVSFKVEPGQIVSIVGANGAGKSTILKSVSSVLPLDRGFHLLRGAEDRPDCRPTRWWNWGSPMCPRGGASSPA